MVCKIAEVIYSRGTTLLTWIHHLALILAQGVRARGRRRGKLGLQVTILLLCSLQSFLTKEASTAVKELLPGWAGGELAETCSWADTQRFRYRWSSPLHFADTPGDCEFDYARKLEPC